MSSWFSAGLRSPVGRLAAWGLAGTAMYAWWRYDARATAFTADDAARMNRHVKNTNPGKFSGDQGTLSFENMKSAKKARRREAKKNATKAAAKEANAKAAEQ